MFWNQYAHSSMCRFTSISCRRLLAESWFQAIMFMLYTQAKRIISCMAFASPTKHGSKQVMILLSHPCLSLHTIYLCKCQLGSSSAALQAGQWSTSYLIGVRSDRRHHHLMRKAAFLNRLTSPSSSARNFMHVPSSIDRPCHIGTCIFIHYIYSYIYIIFFITQYNSDTQYTHTQSFERTYANPTLINIFKNWASKSLRLTKSLRIPCCRGRCCLSLKAYYYKILEYLLS